MEAALVSAATGALKPVLEKLFALMAEECKRFKEVRKDIKFLSDELAAMYAFLLKMSEEEEDPDPQDKAWVNEVRELSYDMEDSIDDFMQHADDKDAKPDGFMNKINHFLGNLGKMKTRWGIVSEIQELKKQIVDVGDRNKRYRTPGQTFYKTINETVDPRALAIFKHASELVGIDEQKAKLINLLMVEHGCPSIQQQQHPRKKRKTQQQQQQQPKVVSIVGPAGMGKTTLANQAYLKLKGQFECHAIATVSRNPDMSAVLRSILNQVTHKDCADTPTVQHLLSKISNFLANKRYLIVVDDIWKKEAWDVIKCAFPVNSCGSKIITTTRKKDVGDYSCQSPFGGNVYDIRPLGDVHSKQLFHQRLFKPGERCPPHLEKLSKEILEKCAGLPLAIIAISGLLANIERTNHQWDRVKDSIGCGIEINDDVKGMMKILSLSYFDLPAHLKTCLLYLSVFPEDYIIERQPLIRKWIAEGFIHKEGRYTSVEVGEKCFNELINRSLIQPVKTLVNGKVESCRVHDIILDFIISKSIEENFVTLAGDRNPSTKTQSTVRRLSLQVGKQGSSVLKTGISLSHVRSLSVFGKSVQIPSLDRFKHLRVMDLEGCYQLKKHHLANIGRLFQLRFLSFKGTWIHELPEQIGHLRCLETLDLRSTGVCELPKSIVNLENLVHLLGDGFPHGFPNGIAKMQALETLQRVNAFEQSLEFLQDLGQLQNMRELVLYLTSASSVKEEWVEALVSSLRELGTHNLSCVALSYYPPSLLMEPWYSAPDLAGLQKLFAYHTAVPQVPDWMHLLVNLQQLFLVVEEVGQKDLCILGGLPALLSLTLESRKSSKEKLIVNGGVGFSRLKEFVYTVYGGMELMFAVGSGSMPMPKLEILEIRFDIHETQSVCGTSGAAAFDFGIENLPCLVTLKWGNVDSRAAAFETAESAESFETAESAESFETAESAESFETAESAFETTERAEALCGESAETMWVAAIKAAAAAVDAAEAAMERAASAHPNSPTLHYFGTWQRASQQPSTLLIYRP